MTRLIEENDARVQGQGQRSLEGSGPSNNSNNHHSRVKLPPIKLPTSNGGYEHSINFSDIFNATPHENETLTDIQKF
jgi:hypothetical protein